MAVLIVFVIMGLFFIYKSKKTDARLLFYMGLGGITGGLTWLGLCVDFMAILITGSNMDNTYGLRGILSMVWAPPFIILMLYIVIEIAIPKKKWHIISFYIILGIIFELFIFLDPKGSFNFSYPDSSGENLIGTNLTLGSPASIIYLIFVISLMFLWEYGFLYKYHTSTGILKKKYLILAIGMIYSLLCVMVDALIAFSIIGALARAGAASGLTFFYFGLKEESDEIKKEPVEKELKIEESLFRITQRPERLTEEEVYISKEKKVCIVCKGEVAKFLYMCPKCNTFYCAKCSESLITSENACWVCNTPIDESRPSKLFNIEEKEDVTIHDKIEQI